VLVVLGLIAWVSKARAQDLEPRSYTNTPVGLNFLIVGYGYSHGGVAPSPSLPLENADVRVDSVALTYVHSLGLWGKSAKVTVVTPYAWASGSASFAGEFHQRDVSGLSDPALLFSVNFYGAPALSPEEFASYRQNTIVGASLRLTAPLGQYDADKLLNIGTNRWSLKPELGVSKALGRLTLEMEAAATFYTENNEFLGSRTLKQDPIYSVQGHVIYSFRSGVWAAFDTTYYTGGSTTVDGVGSNNLQRNTRAGVTLALPVSRRNSIKLYGSSGVSTRTGNDFTAVGIAWQYRWGAGL
jgi:hypothetical protein